MITTALGCFADAWLNHKHFFPLSIIGYVTIVMACLFTMVISAASPPLVCNEAGLSEYMRFTWRGDYKCFSIVFCPGIYLAVRLEAYVSVCIK